MHHSVRGGEKDKWNQAETKESHIMGKIGELYRQDQYTHN